MGDLDVSAIRARVAAAGEHSAAGQDAWWRMAHAAPTDLATLCAEVERLRAVIDGRTTAPTDEGISAHAKAGGAWLHSDAADGALVVCQDGWQARTMRCRPGRWWALGPDKRVCAWPEVTP